MNYPCLFLYAAYKKANLMKIHRKKKYIFSKVNQIIVDTIIGG